MPWRCLEAGQAALLGESVGGLLERLSSSATSSSSTEPLTQAYRAPRPLPEAVTEQAAILSRNTDCYVTVSLVISNKRTST